MSSTTWDPANKQSVSVLSNGNLTAGDSSGTSWAKARSTDSKTSGKWYFECTVVSIGAVGVGIDDGTGTLANNEAVGNMTHGYGMQSNLGVVVNHAGTTGTTGWTITNGDTIMFAIDFTSSKIFIGHNGSWYNSGNPVTGVAQTFNFTETTFFATASPGASGESVTANFGATPFTYTIPTGFTSWTPSAGNDGSFALTETQDASAYTGDVLTQNHATFAITETQDSLAGVGDVISTNDGSFALVETQDSSTINGSVIAFISVDFALTEAQDTVATFGGVETGPTKVIMACGDAGILVTSLDGITWTQQNTETGVQLNAVAFDGSVNWVAVGASGTIILSSDTQTWAGQVSPTSGTYQSVCYGGGQWVTVDGAGNIVTSPDGLTWTKVFTATSSLFGVCFGDNRYVAVGNAGRLYSSSDGITWTQRTNPLGVTFGFRGVFYGESVFVATGTNGKIIASGDGITWVARSNSDTITSNGVYYNGTTWVSALSTNNPGKIDKSTNTSAWSAQTINSFSTTFGAVVYTWDQWVLVGGRNSPAELLIYTSPDAITWTLAYSPSDVAVFRGVTWGTIPATLYISGNLSATETQDTVLISSFGVPITIGTFALTEAQDSFVSGGFNNVTVHGPLAVTEAQDVFVVDITEVFVGIDGSFALTEAPDTFVLNSTVVLTLPIVVFITSVETQDIVHLAVSVPIDANITAIETPDIVAISWRGPDTVTIRMLPASFDAMVNFGAELFNGGFLQIYTGAQPFSPSDTATGTLLATIILPAVAFTTATNGAATIAGTWQTTALTNGNAGWFRLADSTFTNRIDGSAGGQTSGSDLVMSNPSVSTGDTVQVTSVTFEFDLLNST